MDMVYFNILPKKGKYGWFMLVELKGLEKKMIKFKEFYVILFSRC